MVLECLVCVSSPQTLMEDEPEKYQSHFSEYLKREIDADCMEALYKKVHAAIRADPTTKKSEKEPLKEHKRLVAILLNTRMLIFICVYIFNQCIYCNHQHDFACVFHSFSFSCHFCMELHVYTFSLALILLVYSGIT